MGGRYSLKLIQGSDGRFDIIRADNNFPLVCPNMTLSKFVEGTFVEIISDTCEIFGYRDTSVLKFFLFMKISRRLRVVANLNLEDVLLSFLCSAALLSVDPIYESF